MKVIIAGSRSITDPKPVKEAIRESPHNPFFGEIVTGEAPGVDTIAKKYSSYFEHINYKGFPVTDEEYEIAGDSAYYTRNVKMAEYADALIAVWDHESDGTRNMIDIALDHGLDVYVKVVNPQSLV